MHVVGIAIKSLLGRGKLSIIRAYPVVQSTVRMKKFARNITGSNAIGPDHQGDTSGQIWTQGHVTGMACLFEFSTAFSTFYPQKTEKFF
jgi:hypothetical protein